MVIRKNYAALCNCCYAGKHLALERFCTAGSGEYYIVKLNIEEIIQNANF